MEVSYLSKGIFSRRRKIGPPRRARAEEVLSNAELEVTNLAYFKNQPGDNIFYEIPRPINSVCLVCVPSSQATINRNFLIMGSHDCLMFESMNKCNPFYVRLIPGLFYYLHMPNTYDKKELVSYNEIDETLTSLMESESDRIKSVLTGTPLTLDDVDSLKIRKFISNFGPTQIKASISNFVRKMTAWMMSKVFGWMFEGVCVHEGELEMISTAIETGLPIIYIPLNRSNLDPFLISWIFTTNGMKPPYFIAPHTIMKTPILRSLCKLIGGLGFKDRTDLPIHNPELNSTLPIYFSHFWQKGNSVIYPIESRRSRSGKPSTSIVGRELISVLLNMHQEHQIEDAFIIPMSMNYEVLPEEDMITNYTLCGPQKQKLFDWFPRFWKNKGFSRISFSQPFRLREFKLSKTFVRVLPETFESFNIPLSENATTLIPGAEQQWAEENGSIASISSIYGETDYTEPVGEELQQANAILTHSLYDASHTTIFMSTHLVAFLVLKKYRNGVTMNKLAYDLDQLAREIKYTHKHDIGFTGDSEDVVKRAISLLGDDCFVKSIENGVWTIKPDLKKSSLVKLNYYANHVTPLFAMEGIISIGVFYLATPAIDHYENKNFRQKSLLFIQEADLLKAGIEIVELMKTEFLLYAPCRNAANAFLETLDRMKENGHFKYEDVIKQMYLDDDDFDEYEIGVPFRLPPSNLRITINNRTESLEILKFYKSLITPYLQFYAFAVQTLKILLRTNPSTPSDEYDGVEDIFFRNQIYEAALKRREDRLLGFDEIITMETIRNFMTLMQNMDVVRFYANAETNWKKVYYLSPRFDSSDSIDELSASIYKYSYCFV